MRLVTFITVVLLIATLAIQAKAAGLGDIKIYSGLSQPLRAEIPIKLSHPGEKVGLNVALAIDQGFSTNELASAPADLKLLLSETANGEPVVLVSTTSPVVEPAFSIFILLTAQDSRILREYTLLLDWPTQEQLNAQAEPVTSQQAPAADETESTVVTEVVTEEQTTAQVSETLEERPSIYVPKKSETLWSIADKLRPNEQVSIHTMLKAIADTNPNAFNHGNINSLKGGFVLQVPGEEVLTTINHQNAVTFINQQNDAWANRHNPTEASVVTESTVVEATVTDTPVVEKTAADQQAVDDLEKQALLKRIASLESQLTTMESMLLEVNRDLADAQESVQETPTDAPLSAEASNEQANVATAPVVKEEVAATTKPSPAVETPVPQAPVTPKPAPVAAEEESFFGMPLSANKMMQLVSDNNSIIVMGAGILLIIGALFTYRAKRKAEEMATNALVTIPVATEDQGPLEDPVSVVESMGVEEDESDEEALDRIVEIDVYLAYGRYSEAEALANEGIAEEPDRVDYHLKLFEVYKASGNKSAFESEAESFYSGLGNEHPEAWDEVVVMGKEICPNHPLFMELDNTENVNQESLDNSIDNMDAFLNDSSQETEAAEETLQANAEALEETEATETDTETLTDEIQEELASTATGENEEVYTGEDAALEEPISENMESSESDSLDSETTELSNEFVSEEVESEPVTIEAVADDDNELAIAEVSAELELQQEQIEEQVHEEIKDEAAVIEENALELSIDETSGDTINEDAQQAPLSSALTDDELIDSAAAEFLDNDLNTLMDDDSFDKDPLAELNDTAAALEEIENQGVPYNEGLGSDQEAVETKLDLVRAYIEMDDQTEAKRILDEILDEGTEEQKQQAQDLISQIA